MRDIFAGTLGGSTVTFVGHPFDTLKVRLQTQPMNPPLYKGLVDCFLKTIKWEGPLGLYKGITSPLTGQVFFRANMFFANAEAQRFLSGYGTRQNTTKDYFIAGAIAWGSGTLWECPIDLVKSQLQVQLTRERTQEGYVKPFNTMSGCAKALVKQNGITGIYQGFMPHLLRNIPAGSLYFGSCEMIRQYYADKNHIPKSQLQIYHNLIGGGVGGFLYWSIFFPIDVIKSSIQTDAINKNERKYKGIVDCASKLYQEGGWRRFYRGYSPCLLRSVPANAVMIGTVAYVTDHLRV
eukprot:TRINITY_DN7791_c0_g1_i2.p1 TRINITY_DN7791_c0_g1~~TRINITY_DN7791_c0_g1_i2.p1  ORF type:complete len:335 (+),score=41.36 TRINITY_DN7791_c0_g1_i2:129-1007(+)